MVCRGLVTAGFAEGQRAISDARTMLSGMMPRPHLGPAADRRAGARSRRIQDSHPAAAGSPHCTEADSQQVQGSQAEGSLHSPAEALGEGMVAQLEHPVLGTQHVASNRLRQVFRSAKVGRSRHRGGGAARATSLFASQHLKHASSSIYKTSDGWYLLRPAGKFRTFTISCWSRHCCFESAVVAPCRILQKNVGRNDRARA